MFVQSIFKYFRSNDQSDGHLFLGSLTKINCATILKIILSLVYCVPLNLVNGSVTYTISPVTNGCHVTIIASFSCDFGFSLSESLSSTCQASGNWTRN